MPSATPFLIGSLTSNTNSATYTITISTASPANNTLILAADASGATDVTAVTDSQGNTWTKPSSSTVNMHASLWNCVNASALSTSDTVTVTYGAANTQMKDIGVLSVAGVTALDKSPAANGSSTAPSVSSTATSTGLEVGVAVFSVANAGGVPTLAAGWTQITLLNSGANQRTVLAYSVLRVAQVWTASATIVSAAWAALMTTYTIPLLAVPSVPAFAAGYAPLDADMQGWITSPLGFCTQGIVLRVEQTSSQSFTANTFSGNALSFDTVLEDPYSGWNSGTNQWQPPYSGWYEIISTVTFSSAAGSASQAFIISGNRIEFNEIAMSSLNPSGVTSTYIAYLIGGTDNVSCTVNPQGAGPYTSDVTNVGRRSSMEISFLAT